MTQKEIDKNYIERTTAGVLMLVCIVLSSAITAMVINVLPHLSR
jgi:hypothetical protein